MIREFLKLCADAVELNGNIITEKYVKFQEMIVASFKTMTAKLEDYVGKVISNRQNSRPGNFLFFSTLLFFHHKMSNFSRKM